MTERLSSRDLGLDLDDDEPLDGTRLCVRFVHMTLLMTLP